MQESKFGESQIAGILKEADAGSGALAESAELAVTIHVLHEVPDASRLPTQLHAALRTGGLLLIDRWLYSRSAARR
jgi:hypothetical protein